MMLALLRKEMLALSRDPHALAALFIMPAIFIVVMSLALKNVYTPPMDRLDYGIDVREPSIAATRFVEHWEKTHGLARKLGSDWQTALSRGKLAYVLVLEKDLMPALVSPQAPQNPVVRLFTEPGLAQSALRSLQAELAGAVSEMRAAAQAAMLGESATPPVAIDAFIASEVSGDKKVVLNAVQQNVPAWLAFGMFFVVTAISSLFIQEQRDGTLARLVSIGAPARKLILAKALPYLLINAIQAALMLAVGVELMPLLGGDALSLAGIHWPALLMVLASLSVAAIGFALLIACAVRTHAQANTVGPMLNILMAALGGVMVPTMVMPAMMQQIAAWSPMNWGLEGLLSVLVRDGAIADAWPWAARLLIFGGVSLMLASVFFSRRIRA